jgi:5-keto-L-gluconate epimerase
MDLSLTVQTPEVPLPLPVALLSGSFEEKLRKASEYGAQAVELVPTEPAGLDEDWIMGLLARNGLHLSGIASGAMASISKLTLLSSDPAVAAAARERLGQMIDLAARLHAPVVTVGSFRGRMVGERAASLEQLAVTLHAAGERAAAQAVRIAVEPLNRFESDLINTVSQGLEFLERVDHPAVGLLVDTFHVNIEESSWTEPYRQAHAAGKLFHVHLGDNHRLSPGRGLIDFAAIVKTLSTIGYSGYLTAEHLALPDPDTAAQQTLVYMRNLMEA